MKLTYLALAVGLIAFQGCKKDTQTSSSTDTGITYELSTSDHTATLGVANSTGEFGGLNGVSGGSITWLSGYANTSEIRFAAKGDGGKVEYKSHALQHINLIDAVTTIGFLSVDPGDYEKIELKIKFVPVGNEAAFELAGEYTNNGLVIPVVFRVDEPFELKVDYKEKTKFQRSWNYSALHSLQLNLLTQGIPEALFINAMRTNGVLIVSPSSNNGMYKLMIKTLTGMLKVKVKKR